jgi:hypothetical protein
MVAMIHRQYSCASRVQLGCNPFAVVYGLSQRFGRDTDTEQTLDSGLLIDNLNIRRNRLCVEFMA